MSQWTHVKGCLRLDASPFEYRKNKFGQEFGILPFPDKQFVLGLPESILLSKGGYTQFGVYEYALPRVKAVMKSLVAKIMPSGETHFKYFLNSDRGEFSESSNKMDYPIEERLFKSRVLDFYNADPYNNNCFKSFAEVSGIYNIKLGFVHYGTDVTFTVDDDIRYCSGEQLEKAFRELFTELEKHDIRVDSGIVQWRDEFQSGKLWQITADSFDKPVFSVLNV